MSVTLDELLEEANTEMTSLTDPVIYQYYKNLSERKIIINKDIDTDIIERAVFPLMEMDNDGTGKQIDMYLNTVGGSVYDGFVLVDAIEHLKTKTVIHIMGMAMSMGAYIAMAGYNNPNVTVVCNKYCVGLIHAGIVGYGTMDANAARDLSKFNEKYADTVVREFVLSHSKITEEIFEDIQRKEHYMTAKEMLELGIVDAIC